MPQFSVTIRRAHETTEVVEADSAEEAFTKVNKHDYKLPPLEEWWPVDDWMYWVFNDEGMEVLWVA